MQSYTGYSFFVSFSFLTQQDVCFISPCYHIYQQFALFHYCAVFHCKKIHYLFINSTTDGYLDCFQFGTMMIEASMNTLQVDICRAWGFFFFFSLEHEGGMMSIVYYMRD